MVTKDNELYFAKTREGARIPEKEDENAGYDIWACFEEDYRVIQPHNTELIPTGIASAMSPNWFLHVFERGSTSKKYKISAGVIDSGYRGEIFIAIANINDRPLIISKLPATELWRIHGTELSGIIDNMAHNKDKSPIIYPYKKAIAQLVLHSVPTMIVKEISYEDLKSIESKRGTGALGSSGR